MRGSNSRSNLLELVQRDKKVFGDAPRWILPTAIGRALVSSQDRPDTRAALGSVVAMTLRRY